MKAHNEEFETKIKTLGREIKSILNVNGQEYIDELFNITLLYETSLLKSVMKCLKFESSLNLDEKTVVNYRLGVKMANNEYQSLSYGNYIIYENE